MESIDKENIISYALDTDEGRTVLAQSMVEPIRRALKYPNMFGYLFPSSNRTKNEMDISRICEIIVKMEEKF